MADNPVKPTYPTLVSYDEALAILQSLPVKPLGTQQVHFKNALNRICAQDVCAKTNVPAYPTSAMDGWAINFNDIPTLINEGLKVMSVNKAGNPAKAILQNGYAIKTFTGSLMPENADTLVLVEYITQKDSKIFLNVSADNVQKGQWIRKIGDNYQKGDVLLKNGDRIGAFEIGLLAELNQSFIQVYQKARVGIICIGDEIIEVGQEQHFDSSVRSVNPHLLESLLLQMGQEPIVYPLIKDDKALIKRTLESAIAECDMVITTGGMSMGDYDYTQELIKELGHVHFKGVRLKPGKPVACASCKNNNGKDTFILGLPGFPNSSAVTFLLFGSRILARMQHRIYEPFIYEAKVLEDVKRADSRMEFRAAEVHNDNGTLLVSFKAKKSLQSSMINNLTHSTVLAILEENGSDVKAGEIVKIMFLNHF